MHPQCTVCGTTPNSLTSDPNKVSVGASGFETPEQVEPL
ncbi:hypothetical protein WN51_00438 [Melipona quadrifasciata]|uniref:Uncharacterized protein n=1 Tax=Melipona quadrifasciata TaxID=166423 RepID=A0A0M8ZZT3_9HYME|nr:hypothetical protein WN51_00438 [Melipona quadrifasciata]